METVLIVWEHGANMGHLARLIPIARALRTSGARVVFSVTDAHSARRYLDPEGFAWNVAPACKSLQPFDTPVLNFADILLRSGIANVTVASAVVKRWLHVFEELRPSAVLIDESPLALFAAKAAELATVVLGHGFEIPPDQQPLPLFAPWIENAEEKGSTAETTLSTRLRDIGQCLGGRHAKMAPSTLAELFPVSECMLCTWPELDHINRPLDTSTYVGPIWTKMPGAMLVDWPKKPGPKVLCYVNLLDKRYDLLWQSMTACGANILVVSPSGNPRACASARGWGIEVVQNPVSVDALLPECSAVVGHGGMGLTSMSLANAKPLLLLPEHMEQFILTQRLSRRGLARGTIRFRNKQKMHGLVEDLLGGNAVSDELRAVAKKYATYRPEQAVLRMERALLTKDRESDARTAFDARHSGCEPQQGVDEAVRAFLASP